MKRLEKLGLSMALGLGCLITPARGGKTNPLLEPSAANVEAIMDEAVRGIARRYNLNEDQMAATSALMKREVRKFLREHEAEVWPLIRDLYASQKAGQPPSDTDSLKRIGHAARSLARLAKEAIFQGNDEWREEILFEHQKAKHDFDMAEMEKTFADIDKNFENWEKGKQVDAPMFPPASKVDRSPPRPKDPPRGLPVPRAVRAIELSFLENQVNEFIARYQLDKGQIDSARSILAEFKSTADDFKRKNHAAIIAIDAHQQAARIKGDLAEKKVAEATREKLYKPFFALSPEMDVRLRALLTTAQRELDKSRGTPNRPVRTPGKIVRKEPKPTKPAQQKKADNQKKPTGSAEPIAKHATGGAKEKKK